MTDTAFRPLADVSLEIVEGPHSGLTARSDTTGQFSFAGTFDDTTRVRATRNGHVPATGALSPICTTCSNPNNRWINLYLAPLEPPVSIAGDYTLSFVADPACALPDDMRTRSYAASISERSGPHNPPNTIFAATFTGARFLEGYDSIWIGVAGDFITFGFGGDGPGLVEQLASDRYVSFDGSVQTSVGPSPVASVEPFFEGTIEYCERRSPREWYECQPTAVSARARCHSKKHQLILRRR